MKSVILMSLKSPKCYVYITLVLLARPLNSCFVACSAVESLSEVIEVWFPLLDCWMSLKDSSVDLLGVEILHFFVLLSNKAPIGAQFDSS